jgi:tetratricopeptide (TPR) repeat protein
VADTASGRRQYPQAVAAYERALTIEPEDAAVWNQLGYVAAYAGNPDLALNALRRYQALRPTDPNPLDSMGDVSLIAGRLKEAEAFYLEAHKKNPSFLGGLELAKAATARLMTGDVAGANGILGEREGNADWVWLTGKRKEAFDRLTTETARSDNREAQARSYAQLAIWAMLLNDRDAAARVAAQGIAVATQGTVGLLALSRFVTMPSAPAAEWAKRAEQMFPNAPPNSVKDLALAYALLLDGHFAEATPLLRNLESRTGPNGERGLSFELAWALIETGKFDEAAPLLRLNPVLSTDNARPYLGLYFPRLYLLRAMVAERAGRAEEAKENRRIYAALGGK